MRRAILLLAVMTVAVLLANGLTPRASDAQTSSPRTIAVAREDAVKKLGFGFEVNQVAGEDFVAGELIVGLEESETKSLQGLQQAVVASNGRVEDKLEDPKNSAILARFPSEKAAKAAVDAFVRRSEVEFVERNGLVHIPPQPKPPEVGGRKGLPGASAGDASAQSVSGDLGTGYQWHHTVIRKTASLGTLSSTPPTVAVIDTGVDYNHPDLLGRVILGRDTANEDDDPMDDEGHGTHVAGIVAANAGNGQFGEGVSPDSKLLAVKVLGADGTGTVFDVAEGMAYARTASTSPEVKVINMSLGGGNSQLQAEEVDAMKAAGKVLVAAAGNENSTSPSYPGADPDTALRVMSTQENDCRSYFSNFSPSTNPTQYNIAAPGSRIGSTLPNNGYGYLSGTSMASPVVAGAAALIMGENPDFTKDQVVERLLSTGESTSCGFASSTRRVDVREALLGTSETAMVGLLLDPFTGSAPSPEATPVNARLFSGTTQLETDATNGYGFYEMSGLAAGTAMTLKGEHSGYVNAQLRRGINIASGQVAGPTTDALPRARTTGNATITIDWKTTEPITDTPGCTDSCNGWDFDLVVKLPNGSYVKPFGNRGSLSASPFVHIPRDSYDDLRPLETAVVGSQAANGTYRVFVDKWVGTVSSGYNPSWGGSEASAQLYNGTVSIGGLKAPPSTCGTSRYWYVGDLAKNGSSYTWTNRNFCTNSAP